MSITVGRILGQLGALCAVLVGLLFVTGCQTDFSEFADPNGRTAPVGGTAGTNETASPSGVDMLKVGDVLSVVFSDTPQPIAPFDVKIREDGTITLILNQTFTAVGKTTGELEKEIRARYVPKSFVNLTVAIHVQNVFYYVGGEVKSPNRYPYVSKTTVLKAIQSAGDFTEYANKKNVRVTRTDGHTQIVNCIKALVDPRLDVEVFPGDKIYVKRRLL